MSAIHYLAHIRTRHRITGPILTLGRQMVFANEKLVDKIMAAHRLRPFPAPRPGPRQRILPAAKARGFIGDQDFFWKLFGQQTCAVDINRRELPDVTFNLNGFLPRRLRGIFGAVLDGGTMEHIFDIPKVLSNIHEALAPGGCVIHMCASSGYLDHGYYQISPSLLFDFYGSLGYRDMEGLIAEQRRYRINRTPWRFFEWSRTVHRKYFLANQPIGVYFCARKPRGRRRKPASISCLTSYDYAPRTAEVRPWGLRESRRLNSLVKRPVR